SARRVQVAAERLLDDDPAPPAPFRPRKPRFAQPLHDLAEEIRRRGEVEEDIALRAVGLLDLLQQRLELRVRLRVRELAGLVVERAPELLPERLLHGARRELANVLGLLLAELLVTLFLPRHADDG